MKKVILSKTPLYLQVAEHLRTEIASMNEGDRMASENEMVRRFGVSILTVREALKVLANEGIIERQQGRGTFVSRRKQDTGKHVAVVIDQDISHPMSSPVYFRIAQYARRILSEANVQARLYVGLNNPSESKQSINCPEFVEVLKQEEISGIVAVLAYPDPTWENEVKLQNIPIVRNGWQGDEVGVLHNHSAFIQSAVRKLSADGCKQIALIRGGQFTKPTIGVPPAFKEAMAANGLPIYPEWIKTDFPATAVGAGWSALREIWTARKQRPTGLIVSDDFLFTSLVSAILEMNISVPRDLQIHTLVNKESVPYAPFPFTSYQVSPYKVASCLCNQLLELQAGRRPDNILLELEEVEISSGGAVAGVLS